MVENKMAGEEVKEDEPQAAGDKGQLEGNGAGADDFPATAAHDSDGGEAGAPGTVDESISDVVEGLKGETDPSNERAVRSDFKTAPGIERAAVAYPAGDNNIDLLMDVNVTVRVEIGRTRKTVGEILKLSPGMLIELDHNANENVDLYLNDKLFASGEVTVVDGYFAVKITKLISRMERLRGVS